MDDILAGQVSRGGICRSSVAYEAVFSNPSIRIPLNFGSAAPGNDPGHPAAVFQLSVGCVNDSIHGFQGEIALNDLELATAGKFMLPENLAHAEIVHVLPGPVNARE